MKVNEFGSGGPTEPEDLFEMANLYPDTTGLPMTVWVSPRGSARHDVRVKVNMTHGNQMSIANTAVVGVRLLRAGGIADPSARAFQREVTRVCIDRAGRRRKRHSKFSPRRVDA